MMKVDVWATRFGGFVERARAIAVVLTCVLPLAACDGDDTGPLVDEPGFKQSLPVRASPAGLDVAAAWALFDRDITTRWQHAVAADGAVGVTVELDRALVLSHVKLFNTGGAAGKLELLAPDGRSLTATPLDLGAAPAGWSSVAVELREPISRVQVRADTVESIGELELWADDGTRRVYLQTNRVFAQVGSGGTLVGQVDLVEASPARVALTAGGANACGELGFELLRSPTQYRRAWIAYQSAGVSRTFALSRSLNSDGVREGMWLGDPAASGVLQIEQLDPERLRSGANTYRFCVPTGAAAARATIENVRFIGELDHGTNLIDEIAIGTADAPPTRAAATLLDPFNTDVINVAANERVVVAFERFISPDAIVIATDRDGWRAECLDEAGRATPLATASRSNGSARVLAVQSTAQASCAGLALRTAVPATLTYLAIVGSSARQRIDWPRIVLASPREHFGRMAWVEGWASAPSNVAGDVRIELDREVLGAAGRFGRFVYRAGDRQPAWPITIVAASASGSQVTRQFLLDYVGDASARDVDDAYGRPGTPLTAAESAARFGVAGQVVATVANPASATSIRLGSHVGVDIPAGATSGPTTITIRHLDASTVPPLDPGMINVTAPVDHGFEFLPHGQTFRRAVEVVLPFDPSLVPSGYVPDDVHAYYFDETARRWKRLARSSVNPTTGLTRSQTDHFTVMVNAVVVAPEHPELAQFNPNQLSGLRAADPGARVNLIEPPRVSSTGDAMLSYPIDIPPARGRTQPALSLQYNSSRENGWLGVGWNLDVPSISIDTRWGVPRYDEDTESETYLLAGEQLAPMAHRGPPIARTARTTVIGGETVRVFHTRVEREFAKIIRHGDHPSRYWWEVIDKQGTRFFYGGDPASAGPASESTLVNARGDIFHWALREVRDAHGNFARYCTERVQNSGLVGGTVPGHELYLTSIDYTRDAAASRACTPDRRGPYSVVFLRDSHVGGPSRPDVLIDARGGFKRVTAERLRRIEVRFGGDMIRAYVLDYDVGAFHKSRLQRIRQLGPGDVPFPGNVHELAYHDDVRPDADAPTAYTGFAARHDWVAHDDDVAMGLAIPQEAFSVFGSGQPSALGGAAQKSVNGHLYVGFNPSSPSKDGSFGGKVGFGSDSHSEKLSFMDIDGDGLPDKVFQQGSSLVYRRNRSGPSGAPQFSTQSFTLSGLPTLTQHSAFMASAGAEVYASVFGFLVNHSESMSMSSTYFSDANGDGLPDLVNGGQVLFNQRTTTGEHQFVATSAGTPVPIEVGTVDPTGILPAYDSIVEANIDRFPAVDTVRVWVAPMFGRVDISAPVRLAALSPDGVRVAIQRNDSELWSTDIAGTDLGTKVPTGVSDLFVFPGDRIYFRVQTRTDGRRDEVIWSPVVDYEGATERDVNNLDVTHYAAAGDFIMGGRPGVTIGAPFKGRVRIRGTLQKFRATTDNVHLQIRKSGVVVFEEILAWSSITSYVLDRQLNVDRNDRLELLVRADSPIDLTALRFEPAAELTYVSALSPTGGPIPVTDGSGNPTFRLAMPFDMDIYPLAVPSPRPRPWIAPRDGNITIEARVRMPVGTDSIAFTVKERLQLRHKTRFERSAAEQRHRIHTSVEEGEELHFDFSARDPDVLGSATVVLTVAYEDDDPLFVPWTFHSATKPDLCSRPYRGWAYAGYKGNRTAATQPIRHSGSNAFCDVDPDLGSDTDLPSGRDDLLDQVGNMNTGTVTYVFAPYPGGRTCSASDAPCQIPAGALWAGPDELTYVTGTRMSSSRLGIDDLSMPQAGDISGATAVARFTQSSDNSISISAGAGPIGVSGSVSTGTSTGVVDFMDLNGDSFPDVVSNAGVQYTNARGALAERVASVTHARTSDSVAYNAGIGGSVAHAKSNAKGRHAPTGRSAGGGAQTGSQMSPLGFDLSINGNIATSDVTSDLVDVNGDGLPDRVSVSDSGLMVALNLGYEFTDAELWAAATTISTGNSSQLGGGGGLSYNDGIYGWGGGLSVATTTARIEELVDGFQKNGQTFADLNGDGLLDRVAMADDGRTLALRLNTGNGFGPASSWSGLIPDRDVSESKSTVLGAGAYFTISIPTCLAACYVIINPGAEANQAVERQETLLQDIDGDGYPDHLVSSDDGAIAVALNKTGRTNLLKSVHRPLGARFELDYARAGNTFEMPQHRWTLSRVTVFDGLEGDGADHQVTSYQYTGGAYDRLEREFYGFAQVIETHHDTRGLAEAALGSAPAYRQVRRQFAVETVFTKGLLRRETLVGVEGGTDSVYRDSESVYALREVDSGDELVDPATIRASLSAVFPELRTVTTRVSEGDPTIALVTTRAFGYDALGNVTRIVDSGDAGSDDDYVATLTYTGATTGTHASCADRHLVSFADSIVVTDADGRVLRSRSARFDCTDGDLEELQQRTDNSAGVARSNFVNAANGNLVSVIAPANHRGQRYQLDFTYDSQTATHVTSISDSYGEISTATYDLRFGALAEQTDSNGNTVSASYDVFGRTVRNVGPYEQGTAHYTIEHVYHLGAPVPFARTRHIDRYRDAADPIDTLVFTDGLRRVVQTKKDATVHRGASGSAQDVMTISGRVTFDHVGRTAESYYPREEAKASNETFASTFDAVTPTRVAHDVLDRMTLTTYPDGTTASMVRTLGPDRGGVLRHVSTSTDALLNRKVQYADVRERVRAFAEPDPSTSEVIWTEYQYDPMEELVAVVDARGNQTRLAYDLLGRRTEVNNPDTGRIETVYDNASNVVRKVTARLRATGEAIEYEYDFTRLVSITYPQVPANNATFDYGGPALRGQPGNRVGRITRVSDGSGSEQFRYGKLGEIVEAIKTVASDTQGNGPTSPEVWTTRYVYDTWGRLQQMTYPDGERLTYAYDSGGSVREVTGEKLGIQYPYVTRLEYDKFEQRAFIEMGNGIRTSFTYDAQDRRLARLETGGFQKLTFGYDDVGNVTSLVNDVPSSAPSELGGRVEQTYSYDGLYRLTSASGSFRQGPSKTDEYSVSLGYDLLHNIRHKTQQHTVQSAGGEPIVQQKTTYALNYAYGTRPHAPTRIGDREYFYDANGNQGGWDNVTNGQRRRIAWDDEDRIQSISDNGQTTTFKYNAAGERVIKRSAQGETAYVNQFWTVRDRTVGTKHVFVGTTRLVSKLSTGEPDVGLTDDPFARVLGRWYEQRSAEGGAHAQNEPNAPVTGPNRVAARMPNQLPDDNFIYFYHPDHLGSTSYVTDPEGELYEHVEYFPFGETWVEESSNTERLPYLFTSKELDQETDLYYMSARYYDPRTSVWQSTDPLLAEDPAAAIGASMVLAPYSYANLNPLRFIDPTGRDPEGTQVLYVKPSDASGKVHIKGKKGKQDFKWSFNDAGARAQYEKALEAHLRKAKVISGTVTFEPMDTVADLKSMPSKQYENLVLIVHGASDGPAIGVDIDNSGWIKDQKFADVIDAYGYKSVTVIGCDAVKNKFAPNLAKLLPEGSKVKAFSGNAYAIKKKFRPNDTTGQVDLYIDSSLSKTPLKSFKTSKKP